MCGTVVGAAAPRRKNLACRCRPDLREAEGAPVAATIRGHTERLAVKRATRLMPPCA